MATEGMHQIAVKCTTTCNNNQRDSVIDRMTFWYENWRIVRRTLTHRAALIVGLGDKSFPRFNWIYFRNSRFVLLLLCRCFHVFLLPLLGFGNRQGDIGSVLVTTDHLRVLEWIFRSLDKIWMAYEWAPLSFSYRRYQVWSHFHIGCVCYTKLTKYFCFSSTLLDGTDFLAQKWKLEPFEFVQDNFSLTTLLRNTNHKIRAYTHNKILDFKK